MKPPSKETISRVMSELGKRTSPKKAASSATNGKLGGAPVKKHDPASILRRLKYAEKKNRILKNS